MTKRSNLATAEMGAAAPLPNLCLADPLVVERTIFSEDRTHRFTLFRHWPGGNIDDYVVAICMNASGASEEAGDPTVNKMVKFAREYWGAGAFYMLNALSIRGTYSRELGQAECVNRPENDEWIRKIVPRAKFVVAAWGNPGADFGRDKEVEKLLLEIYDPARVFCFGKNKNGTPTHPLYMPFSKPLVPYF